MVEAGIRKFWTSRGQLFHFKLNSAWVRFSADICATFRAHLRENPEHAPIYCSLNRYLMLNAPSFA
jgi:hypothetical protein